MPSQVDMLSVEAIVTVQGFSPGDGAKPSTATASAALNLLCASRRLLAALLGGMLERASLI